MTTPRQQAKSIGRLDFLETEDELKRLPAVAAKLFLIDDDPIFCKLMAKVAKKRGNQLTVCSSLDELGTNPRHHDFDVVMIDYYVEDLKGTDIAYLMEGKPVLLVSRSEEWVARERKWPDGVKGFVPKKLGPDTILDTALGLLTEEEGPETVEGEGEV